MERTMATIGRLLDEREWESIDEMNAFLQQLMASGAPIDAPPQTPLEQAQDRMYDAWNATGRRRVKLAREALAISPDCADAYVLLAEETARGPRQARELYQQGVEAGERALGPEMFAENAGHFWGIVETRPYMRAREGLATTLWILGEHDAAIEHFRELLRLNPGDNQGIRYSLAHCLLVRGDDEELGALLDQYREDASAIWLYARALHLFRRGGSNRTANTALRRAIRANPFVPLYLLGEEELPAEQPEYYSFGDEGEAIEALMNVAVPWLETPGAVEWLATTLAKMG